MNDLENLDKIYDSLMLLEDLRNYLEKIVPIEMLFKGKLIDDNLSLILGQGKKYIYNVKRRLKSNPNYKISLNLLSKFELNLKKRFIENIEDIKLIFAKYRLLNDLPKVNHGILKYHPDLIIDYFKIINSVEKAYWLGWLYAEAFLTKNGTKVRFGVEIGLKDEELLNNFCDIIRFNKTYKSYPKRDRTVRIRLTNNECANYLISHGFIIGKMKSRKIELPELNNRKLYLAFLLGYYDGDGKGNTTIIVSGSYNFLKQIKERFEIDNKIITVYSKGSFIRGKNVKGKGFNLALGAKLFNEILDKVGNRFPDLLCKRRKFETYNERLVRLHIHNFDKAIKKRRLNMSKDDLKEFAWDLGLNYKFPYDLILQKCNEYNIKEPSKEYWDLKSSK